jgi:hypothetical protein
VFRDSDLCGELFCHKELKEHREFMVPAEFSAWAWLALHCFFNFNAAIGIIVNLERIELA